MNNANRETVILTSVPCRNELYCVKCKIDLKEVQDSSAKSDFHWQTMKCRLIIYVMPEVIASPVPGTNEFIYIIATTKFFKTGKIQANLKEMNIMIVDSSPVTSDVYKVSLRYTILFAMAPQWNKVDKLLLHGRDFLVSTERINGIQWDLFVNDEEIGFHLRPARVEIPALRLEDLYFPHILIAEFMADPNGFIDLTEYKSQWVYVLPSMKKGKLMTISKEIPKRCPFKTYEELRRHWKNMYGYRLPSSADGIIYYEIYFYLLRPNYYTYPHICVRSGPLQLHWNENHAITSQFLHDLMKKVPRICEKQLQILKNNATSVTRSYPLDEETTKANTEYDSRHLVLKAKALLTDALTPCNNVDSTMNLTFSATYVNELCKDINFHKSQTSNVPFKTDSNLMSPTTSLKGNVANLTSGASTNSPISDKICDLSKFAYFKASKRIHEKIKGETRVKYDESINFNEFNCDKRVLKLESENDETNAARQLRESIQSKSPPTFIPRATLLNINDALDTKKYIPIFTPRMSKNEPLKACVNTLNVESATQRQESVSKYFKEQKLHNNDVVKKDVYNGDFKKPIHISNVDIEKMAKDNNLERVTVSTLKNWLKERSIPFTAHERKADLIKKVMTHIQNKSQTRLRN